MDALYIARAGVAAERLSPIPTQSRRTTQDEIVKEEKIVGVKKSAFASRSERENYYKLNREWGDKFKIYHNLPFLNIFTTDDLPDIESHEINRLKKTSVDFVLCNDMDEFILCIDFDGLLQGVNQGTEYKLSLPTKDSWRVKITELKLRVAHASNFPYFIFSSNEFKDMSPEIPLPLVDGIIGDVVANKIAQENYKTFRSSNQVAWYEREAIRLEFQVDAEMTHNPVVKRKWQLHYELGMPPYVAILSGGMLLDQLPSDNPMAKYKSIFPNGIPEGNTVILETEDHGMVWANVNLHEFNSPGYSGFWLGDDIAHLLALDKLYRKRKRGSSVNYSTQ